MTGGRRPDPPQPPVTLPPRVAHGGLTAYQDYGCRCGPCQENKRQYERDAAKLRTTRRVPANAKHGRKYTYSYYRCRCEACCEARRSYDRERWETKNRNEESKRRKP